MNTTSRILGESVRPPTESEKTHPVWAYYYARDVIKGSWPEGEPAIATSPKWAYNYARNILKRRWPEGEPAIATSPIDAYDYARLVIKGRFPEGEAAIAKNPYWANKYLNAFPDAKLEWVLNGLIDWTDL